MSRKRTETESSALNERERAILHAVINSFITTAEPVGSRSVVKRYDLEWSAATVRNVMSDLEEQGFLQQVHTSSGRVPTDTGYRYYVDYLMEVQALSLAERRRIEHEFEEKLDDVDGLLRHTSHLLALVSHQAGLAEAPDDNQARIQRFDLLPIGGDRVALLIVDSFGRVRSRNSSLSSPLDPRVLEQLNNFLNRNFTGIEVGKLTEAVRVKLGELLDEQRTLAQSALEVLNLIPQRSESRLFLDGAVQLFEQPEFQRVEQAREVFGLLEEHDRLISLLRQAVENGDGRAIFISRHEDRIGVEGIGVVASAYHVDGKPAGLIGVLGPRRMPYSKLTSLVQFTADLVGRLIPKFSK